MTRVNLARTKVARMTRIKRMAMRCPAQDPVGIADTKSRPGASPKQRRHTVADPVARTPLRKRKNAIERGKEPRKTGTRLRLRETAPVTEKSTDTRIAGKDRVRRDDPESRKGQKLPRAPEAKARPTVRTSRNLHDTATIRWINHW